MSCFVLRMTSLVFLYSSSKKNTSIHNYCHPPTHPPTPSRTPPAPAPAPTHAYMHTHKHANAHIQTNARTRRIMSEVMLPACHRRSGGSSSRSSPTSRRSARASPTASGPSPRPRPRPASTTCYRAASFRCSGRPSCMSGSSGPLQGSLPHAFVRCAVSLSSIEAAEGRVGCIVFDIPAPIKFTFFLKWISDAEKSNVVL